MRDEDGKIIDGWIAIMPKRTYIFHEDNSASDVVGCAGTRYRYDGFNEGSGSLVALFKHRYVGERHRTKRLMFTSIYCHNHQQSDL